MEAEQKFLQLSTKFLFLNSAGTQSADYQQEINTLLNELNGLNYRGFRLSDGRAPVLVIESMVNIPPQEDTLVVKACFLTKCLVQRQQVVLSETVVNRLIGWLRVCLERCFYQVACEVLETMQLVLRQCSDVSKFYEFLISTNGILVNVLMDPNYRQQQQSASKQTDQCSSSELYLAALLCIESVLKCSENAGEAFAPYLRVVGDAVVNLMFKIRSEDFTERAYYSLTTSALKCFGMIVTLDDAGEWTSTQLGRLIGTAKAFMMHGIPGVTKHVPQRIPVSQQGIPEPQHIPISKGGKMAKTRKTRTHAKGKKTGSSSTAAAGRDKHPSTGDAEVNRQPYSESSIMLEWTQNSSDALHSQTSDSDFSETETGLQRAQIDRNRMSKLRHAALILVGTLAQHVEKRVMFGYWHALFPDENRTPSTVSLLNCMLRDPLPSTRIAAIQATAFMLYRSKPFLVQAESSKKPLMSFTPFSVTLGNMVIETYAMMTQALAQESNLSVLTQLLKCLTVLVQATPFHRLRPGIATEFVTIVQPLVRHRDPTIKVAALMVMGFLISVPDMTEEIAGLVGIEQVEVPPTGNEARSKPIIKALHLQQLGPEEEEEACESDTEETETVRTHPDGQSAGSESISWLLQVALENLGIGAAPSSVMPVRMECLQVLCAMASHYSLLRKHLRLVAQALVNAFGDPVTEVKLVAGRVLDLVGHAVHTSLLSKDTVDTEELNKAVQFWNVILPTATEQIQDVYLFPNLRSACCDALGNIGVHVFEKFPRDRQLALVSMLTGCTFDDDSGIAAAAARALSVYILFPSLRDDACYVENTIDSILRILRDPNLNARIKTSWSLGNVTDALILNHQHNQRALTEGPVAEERGSATTSDSMLKSILEAALESARDNDKVRSNAVRTIGNVLRLLRAAHFEQEQGVWPSLRDAAIERLVQNASAAGGVNVKVKWNACYALANMQKNESFFMATGGWCAAWQKRVFPALCEVVVNCPNFKVRINAAQALTAPDRRSYYGGSHFIAVWTALLQALEQSDNLLDYNEYKRRDTLQQQLCLSLAHCLRLASGDDVSPMAAVLLPLYDAVRQNWVRVVNRILPEKSALLLEAHHVLLEQRRPQGRKERLPNESVPDSAWNLLLKCFDCGDRGLEEK
ncbi:HEAT repeat-containing protein 6 [Anopheles bellator]|uniref:HEAT repeat-containing protein 6 n=1 Tax=Anopheles bellator TaxID=139047 RepID=UPI00264A3EAD|nr:HEAT repeat-containing protein 6 [Anopheles bellator]